MSTLLEKTRRLNKILQKTATEVVMFSDICKTLGEVMQSNVYVASRRGKILGYSVEDDYESEVFKDKILNEGKFSEEYNEMLLQVSESKPNLRDSEYSDFGLENQNVNNRVMTIIPIIGNREKLGTLILSRHGSEFNDEDLVLAEYSAAIVGMEIIRSKHDEIEEEVRKKAVVQLALGTLSYSELEAVERIFSELDGTEGLLVASKIADKVGITRSVIVNALRKFESAGVIESRSLGMKGTHIKILNDKLLGELEKLKN